MAKISISAELEAWARDEVAAGRAASIEELVATLLRERRDTSAFVQAKLDEARTSLAQGKGLAVETILNELDAWIAEDEADAAALRTSP